MLSRQQHLTAWQQTHGGLNPRSSAWVSGYLRLMYVLARPLAVRRVPPDLLTGLAVLASVGVLLTAWADLLMLAALLLVASAVLDGLDGAVAALSDRVSKRGRVLDMLADRVSEILWLAAAVTIGCRLWVALLAGLAVAALEGSRVMLGRIVAVTAAERPVRVLVLAPALLPVGANWTTVLVAVLAGLTFGGLTQLALTRRTTTPELDLGAGG